MEMQHVDELEISNSQFVLPPKRTRNEISVTTPEGEKLSL